MKLNLKRLGLLIRNDLLLNKSTIITFAAALTGVLFLYSIMSPTGAVQGNFHPTAYLLLLFIGGFWTISHTFKDLHEPHRSYAFLTLPASNFEKFLSKLILTSIGYVLITLVFYFLLSLLVVGFSKLLFPNAQYIFHPLRDDIWLYCIAYVILQSVFFLGAAYFKKHALTKTILVLSLLALVLVLFIFILVIIFFGSYHELWASTFTHIVQALFWILLAPFCWVVAYMRLREAEV